jgi:nucleoside-diphosphate-sugar epimerase
MGPKKIISLPVNKVLVTGGNGFVGKAVIKRLLECGVKVRTVGRNEYVELQKIGVECVRGDIADSGVMAKAVEGVDGVFHVAALAGIWGDWENYYHTNVLGTKTVVDACKTNGIQFVVYTSTPSVVFDREDIHGGDEGLNYTSNFLCHYAKTKVIAEKYVLEQASETFRTCALRPHLIWGPGDPHLFPRLLDSGRKKQLKQVGRGENLVDISYIENVAEAHLLALQNLVEVGSANGRPFFISQGDPVNLWDWTNEIFTLMGIEPVTKSVSFKTAYYLGWALETGYRLLQRNDEPKMTRFLAEQLAKSHYFNINSAKDILGYEPLVSTEEGLRKTVEWFKNNEKS